MKKLQKTIVLVVLLATFIACTSDADDTPQNLAPTCNTQNLGITESSKYFGLAYNYDEQLNPTTVNWERSTKWHWNVQNDTIEIYAAQAVPEWVYEGGGHIHHYFKKRGTCVEYLFTRMVSYTDNPSFDPYTGEIMFYTATDIKENCGNNYAYEFELQTFDDGVLFVGKLPLWYPLENHSESFWIDFSPETKKTEPHTFETFPQNGYWNTCGE